MRILMVGSGLLALKRPLDWALADGHEVCLLGDWNPYRKKQPANYHFVQLNILQHQYDAENDLWIDTPVDDLSANVTQLKEVAASFKPDLIHAHSINQITLCCIQAKLRPLVVSAWGFLNYLIENPIEEWAEETLTSDRNDTDFEELLYQVLTHLDILIVENPALVRACQNLLSSNQSLKHLPLGTLTEHFHPNYAINAAKWRQVLKIPQDATVFFSPRGWAECYCQEEIFQAFAKAFADLPQPAILLFVKLYREGNGFITQLETKICNQAKALGIADCLRWLPELPHEMLPTAYNLADVVINYPSTDAFPSTLIEAAACQRAVLTSDLPSYRGTFVEDYYPLIAPCNPEALAKAMVKSVQQSSIEQDDRLKKLRQYIVENYDETIMSQRLMTVYQEGISH
jgi:glycosyltransferase involved in cell wall biosynthesis